MHSQITITHNFSLEMIGAFPSKKISDDWGISSEVPIWLPVGDTIFNEETVNKMINLRK